MVGEAHKLGCKDCDLLAKDVEGPLERGMLVLATLEPSKVLMPCGPPRMWA